MAGLRATRDWGPFRILRIFDSHFVERILLIALVVIVVDSSATILLSLLHWDGGLNILLHHSHGNPFRANFVPRRDHAFRRCTIQILNNEGWSFYAILFQLVVAVVSLDVWYSWKKSCMFLRYRKREFRGWLREENHVRSFHLLYLEGFYIVF